MRIFFSSDDIINLQGVSAQDDANAKIFQKLLLFQLQRNENGFMLFHDWFKNALIDNIGILKAWWEREIDSEPYAVTVDFQGLQDLQQNPQIQVDSVTEVSPGIFKVDYVLFGDILKNQPCFEVIMPSEFRFDPKAKRIEKAMYVAHRKIVTADYLRRREDEGVLENVEQAIDEYGSEETYTEFDQHYNNQLVESKEDEEEEAKREFALYECFFQYDIDNDGRLENLIVCTVGDTIVRLEENTLHRHPFFTISPIRETNRIWAKRGLADLIGEIQDLRTAFLRQIVFNIAVNNDKQAFVNIDVMVDVNEFIDGKKAVRVSGDPRQAVYWMPAEVLPPHVFNFLEYIEEMKQNRSGLTKYTQGLDSSALNKTATGVTAVMNASNQRLELIARNIAETGVKELFSYLIHLNREYIDQATVIRITDQYFEIQPDNLKGNIDIVVNAGLAIGNKQTQMENMQLLLQMYPMAIQAGIAGIEHAAFAFGKLIEEMGYKDTSKFSYTPEQIMQIQQQKANEPPAPPEPKAPAVSIKYEDLPNEGKVQAAANAGITLSPEQVAAMELMKKASEIVNGARQSDGNVSQGNASGNGSRVSK